MQRNHPARIRGTKGNFRLRVGVIRERRHEQRFAGHHTFSGRECFAEKSFVLLRGITQHGLHFNSGRHVHQRSRLSDRLLAWVQRDHHVLGLMSKNLVVDFIGRSRPTVIGLTSAERQWSRGDFVLAGHEIVVPIRRRIGTAISRNGIHLSTAGSQRDRKSAPTSLARHLASRKGIVSRLIGLAALWTTKLHRSPPENWRRMGWESLVPPLLVSAL